jgi:hypothetical protein
MKFYKSDIKLGEQYQDTQTGFIGHAVAIVFYQHGCERVTLKGMNTNNEIVEYGFDAAEVEAVATRARPAVAKVGGPHGISAAPRR